MRSPEYRELRSRIARDNLKDPAARVRLSEALRSSARHKAAMLVRPIPACPSWQEYGELKFRSKWERDFARWLDAKAIQWEYEPRHFVLSDGRRYTPDFMVHTASGPCLVELHRLRAVKPGDDKKVAKLRLAEKELCPTLLLLDERVVYQVQKDLRRLTRVKGTDHEG